jgi:hypothetical protein
MANNDNNRVVSRIGAHELTAEEVEKIGGGKLTFASVLLTGPVSNPDEQLDQ